MLFELVLRRRKTLGIAAIALTTFISAASLHAAVIWTEGEKPLKADVKRHPWWYDKVKKDQLSGGDFISNWSDKPADIEYAITAPKAGEYEFWVRANPVATKLSYQINGAAATDIDLSKNQSENVNIADDGKPDLRFLAWVHVGKVTLKEGANSLVFRMHSDNNNHGMLDCFVLANEPFEPHGLRKPGEPAKITESDQGWFPFEPKEDAFLATAGFDLRSLNEKEAGEHGFINVKNGEFVFSKTGETVRFWAVNGPPEINDPDQLRRCARILAKHGVNMIRIHGPDFNAEGEVDPAKVQRTIAIIEAMKSAGIYTDISLYWFAFMTPKANTPWLEGYNGKTNPVAALYLQSRLSEEVPRMVDRPADDSFEDHGKAAHRRTGAGVRGNAKRRFALLLDVRQQKHSRPADADHRETLR